MLRAAILAFPALALFAFLELLSQAALTGRRLFVPVVSDPGDWLRCAAQRQPAPHVAEVVHQRFDIFIAVQRGRGQAQAFGAARHGREVDRLHVDPVAVQQLVASGLAEVGVADDHRNAALRIWRGRVDSAIMFRGTWVQPRPKPCNSPEILRRSWYRLYSMVPACSRQPWLNSEQRRKILWENCARLYAIETPSQALTAPQASAAE